MEITFDITDDFNFLIDCCNFLDNSRMLPVLFFEPIEKISGEYSVDLMNFGFNINDKIESELKKHSCFQDVLNCTYEFKSLMIVRKAKLSFEGIKGADVCIRNMTGQARYHTWPYKLQQGDVFYSCAGYSPFLAHHTSLELIGNSTSMAKISFSTNDYILMDSSASEFEFWASMQQSKIPVCETDKNSSFIMKCSSIPAKMFDLEYRRIHFGSRMHAIVDEM